MTRLPPGKQVHFPGVFDGDDDLKVWVDCEANEHIDTLGWGSLDCIDVSQNSLTDVGIWHLVEFLIKRQCATKRLKFYKNAISRTEAICQLIEDKVCGIGAKDGLAELHLSHNDVGLDGLRKLLDSIWRRVDAVGSFRPPLWLRLERNSHQLGKDGAEVAEEYIAKGLKLCMKGGAGGGACGLGHCKFGADVHLNLAGSNSGKGGGGGKGGWRA